MTVLVNELDLPVLETVGLDRQSALALTTAPDALPADVTARSLTPGRMLSFGLL